MVGIRDEDLSKYPVRRRLVTAGNPEILRCDQEVPIFDVLKEYCGLSVPGYRFKSHCPFAAEHAEGAETERCFQVYENNTAWCFQHQQRYTSSLLLGYVRQWSRIHSARFLLDKYGLTQHRSYRERYGELAAWLETQRQSSGDVQELAMALQTELAQDPQYSGHEFDPGVREAWTDCLAALDRLAATGAGPEQLRRWYEVARRRLLASGRVD